MGSTSFLFEHQMLHVKANQATTRNMTTNVFTEPYPLFHENDLGAFLLFCIECYMSEAYQAMIKEANQAMN